MPEITSLILVYVHFSFKEQSNLSQLFELNQIRVLFLLSDLS